MGYRFPLAIIYDGIWYCLFTLGTEPAWYLLWDGIPGHLRHVFRSVCYLAPGARCLCWYRSVRCRLTEIQGFVSCSKTSPWMELPFKEVGYKVFCIMCSKDVYLKPTRPLMVLRYLGLPSEEFKHAKWYGPVTWHDCTLLEPVPVEKKKKRQMRGLFQQQWDPCEFGGIGMRSNRSLWQEWWCEPRVMFIDASANTTIGWIVGACCHSESVWFQHWDAWVTRYGEGSKSWTLAQEEDKLLSIPYQLYSH